MRAECHQLLGKTLDEIEQLTGMPSFYPDDSWYAQAATAPLPARTDIVLLKSRLYDEHRVEVPLIDWNGHKLMRVSIQAYNNGGDGERLHEALRLLLQAG